MALDHTHPGGPALANKYLDIMNGIHAPPAPGLPFAPPGAGLTASTTWQQVEWVLDNMWWDYETFVYSCKPAFKIHRVLGQPRSLDLRKRCSMRRWVYRGMGRPAATAVCQLRDSLIAADKTLRMRCYQPQKPPVSFYGPPTMPPGSRLNPVPLSLVEKQMLASSLQDVRDRMSIASQQVSGYIAILETDAQKRQAWLDNAIKLVSAVTALGAALAPI